MGQHPSKGCAGCGHIGQLTANQGANVKTAQGRAQDGRLIDFMASIIAPHPRCGPCDPLAHQVVITVQRRDEEGISQRIRITWDVPPRTQHSRIIQLGYSTSALKRRTVLSP